MFPTPLTFILKQVRVVLIPGIDPPVPVKVCDIAEKVKTADFPSPAIIVVGEVASLELTD